MSNGQSKSYSGTREQKQLDVEITILVKTEKSKKYLHTANKAKTHIESHGFKVVVEVDNSIEKNFEVHFANLPSEHAEEMKKAVSNLMFAGSTLNWVSYKLGG